MTDKKKTKQKKGKAKKPAPKPVKKAAKKAAKKAPTKSKVPAKSKARPKASPKSAAPEHWLRRPETIRKLWIGGLLMLGVLVGVEPLLPTHGYFGIDGLFAFNAWFGFLACVAMIVVSKGLGIFIKRQDTYYD